MENSPLRESGITPQKEVLDNNKTNIDKIETISKFKFVVNDLTVKFNGKDLSNVNLEEDIRNIIGDETRIPKIGEFDTNTGYNYYINKCLLYMVINKFKNDIDSLIESIGISDIIESYQNLSNTYDLITVEEVNRKFDRYFPGVNDETVYVNPSIIDVDPALDYTMAHMDLRDNGPYIGDDIRYFPFIPCFDFQNTMFEYIDETNTIEFGPHLQQHNTGTTSPSLVPSPLTVYDLFEVDYKDETDDITVKLDITIDEVYGPTEIVSNTYTTNATITNTGNVTFTKISDEFYTDFMCRLNNDKLIISIVLYPRYYDINKKGYLSNLHVKLTQISVNANKFKYIDKHLTSYLFFTFWSINDGDEHRTAFVLTPTNDFNNFINVENDFSHGFVRNGIQEFINRIESGDCYIIGADNV